MKFFSLIILVLILCFSCNTKVSTNENKRSVIDGKTYIRQYALCKCIYSGLKLDAVKEKDNSIWGAADICDCSPELLKKIDSLSEIAAKAISPIQASDDSIRRPIIIGCSDFSNSAKLDSLINSYQKYQAK